MFSFCCNGPIGTIIKFVRFQIVTAASMEMTVALCILVEVNISETSVNFDQTAQRKIPKLSFPDN
jgi:hypothetical protein